MLDQPRSADHQVFSNSRRRTSAEGTTDGDHHADERSDSTCEQLHVRHLKAESAREGPISSEYSHRPARSLSRDRGLSVRMRVGKSCAVHGPQHTPSLDRQATGLIRLPSAPQLFRVVSRPPTDEALRFTSRSCGGPGHRLADARHRTSSAVLRGAGGTRDKRSKTSTKFPR